MKRKTLLALFLALVVSLMAVLALAGCDSKLGGDDDDDNHAADNSFAGCLSETTYEDATSAARGFLSEELDGAATQTQFVDAEKGKELSAKEIADLELGDDINVADIDSAVYYTVKYVEVGADAVRAVANNSSDTKAYEIIIIKIGSHYYYYIPIMPKGGVITNSYIAMVCDPQKYLNVTETSVSTSTTTAQGTSVTATVTSTAKLAGDKGYFKIVTSVLGMEQVVEYYIVTVENNVYMYSYNEYSEKWQISGFLPYDSFDEYILEELFKFDHSYFERTKSGFKMTEDKLQQYLNDVMGNLASLGLGYTVNNASANYYVKNARLDEVIVDLTMNGTTAGIETKVSVSAHTTYTNYGTTVVELPFDV